MTNATATAISNQLFYLATLNAPPNAYPCAIRTLFPSAKLDCVKPGAAVESIGVLARQLGITTNINISLHDTGWGTLHNGSWTGLLRLIKDEVVDFATVTFFPTPDRIDEFYPTFPIQFDDDPTFLVPKSRPNVMNSAMLVLTIFRYDLWICLFAIVTLLALVIRIAAFVGVEDECVNVNPYWACVRLATPRGADAYMRFKCNGGIFSWLILGLTITLFHELYQGQLRGVLLTPNRPASFENADQIAEAISRGELKLMLTHDNTWYSDNLQKSQEGIMKKLRLAGMASHGIPYEVVHDTREIQRTIANGEGVVLGDRYLLQEILRDQCQIEVLNILEFKSFVSVMFLRKNFELRHNFSEAIIRSIGQLMLIEQKYLSYGLPDCGSGNIASQYKPLGILHMSGAIAVWFMGLVVSACVMIIEMCSNVKPRKKSPIDTTPNDEEK